MKHLMALHLVELREFQSVINEGLRVHKDHGCGAYRTYVQNLDEVNRVIASRLRKR